MLNITRTGDNETVGIALDGRLDTTTAPQLEEMLAGIYDDVRELTFDLTDLVYVATAGLRVILAAQKRINEKGAPAVMTVRNPSDDIMEIFEMTGFDQILTILSGKP